MTNNIIEKRLIFSLFLAVFLLYGCGSKDQAEVSIIKKKVQVQEIVLQSELTTSLKASGTVVPKEYSVIRSLTPGTVNYLVPVGSEVYVGQPLFSLSDSSIESAYFNANRSFEQTRVISNQKVTQAELALNGAKARLDLARSQHSSALAQSEQALKVAEDSAIVAYDSAYNISNQILNYLMMGGIDNSQYHYNIESLFLYRNIPTINSQLRTDTTALFPEAFESYLNMSRNADKENILISLNFMQQNLSRIKSLVDNINVLLQTAQPDPNTEFTAVRLESDKIIMSGYQAQINQNISTIINSINAVNNTIIGNRLSADQSQAQMDLAEIDYKNSELSLANAREGAQLEQSISQSQLDQAAYNYKNLNLPSPFSGTILSHYISSGEQVSVGRELLELGNLAIVEISVDVDLVFAKNIKVNDEVLINGKYKGLVAEVGPTGNLTSGKVEIKVQSSEAQADLAPSSIAEVEFNLIYKDINSIVVPIKSVTIEASGNYVYVVGQDDKVERRNVVLGQVYGDKVSIVSGLEEGELLVILNGVFVSAGDEVEIVR